MSVGEHLDAASEDIVSQIERASPFIDEKYTGQWRPSAKLLASWYMAATDLQVELYSNDCLRINRSIERVNEVMKYVDTMLGIARQRWLDGFYADPYGEPVKRMAA